LSPKLTRFLLIGTFVGVAVATLLLWNHYKVGTVLDSYRGVPVYDKGVLFFRSHGKHFSLDGYYYGQKWQCVEFIKRFFCDAKHHKMPDVMGHAKSFFDDTLSDGALNRRRGLIQFRNGSVEKPRPDDLVVFTDTRYGHVGIVTETASNNVEMIQQNILWHTRQRLSLIISNNHYFLTAPRTPAGWMRLPP
jgi:hypothetical protein